MAVHFLSQTFRNLDPQLKFPTVYFAGNSISGTYLAHLLTLIGDRHFSINVLSKSGTTTTPSLAFRILLAKLITKYGKDGAKTHFYATTDRAKGALLQTADATGYTTFVVPQHVGGRFSVMSAVGLLPIAVAGGTLHTNMRGLGHGH